ncbi:hypothetical protein GLAREA_07254 [Glarea lozoyensis ATCC 20868]|uniref:Uncharacterized protein n=1 Tax=Glarea lozoyensis (strain ATCC 20868 / MF5171) TaxID=1116229 RepID=S3DQD2_GLAL2|nr:uncharacterized protein GLAREA_07254 [Glarea lozoyensis ATCC 20868]EPE34241.1 hypothetical protein GLAREA_07254 [Glarea lozoyensis ATCC 20868]
MSSKSRSSKAQGSSSRPTPSSPPVSFLFIVNELPTNDNPEHEGSVEALYVDGRWRPPVDIRGFFAQEPGAVYRWKDGTITRASEFGWSTQQLGQPPYADGTIFRTYNGFTDYPTYYRAATVFYCNRFDLFFTARGDASVRNIRTCDPEEGWHPLTFHHDGRITRAEHAGDQAHTRVREADWITQLIPTNYRAASGNTTSGGLAGLLPIVISLVAFSCTDPYQLDEILMVDRAWRGHRWHGHRRDTGRIGGRGVITTVYLDPDNPEGSNPNTLWDVEYGNTPIFR